jgi:hypothetical protein
MSRLRYAGPMSQHAALFIEELRREARRCKVMADQALAQVDDAAFTAALDPETNSIAILVKHVANNLRSRWTDFYDTDGEKPDRHRDGEFELAPDDTRAALMTRWDAGWQCLFTVLDTMTADDLGRIVIIRAEPHTVPRAILRALTHAANHVGQIVMLAKHLTGTRWQTLSIPRGHSEQVNAAMRARFGERP